MKIHSIPLVPRFFIRPFIKKAHHGDGAVKSTEFIGCQVFSVFLHWCEIIKKKKKLKDCQDPMHCHGTRQGHISSSFSYVNYFFLFFFLSLEVSHFPTLVLATSTLSYAVRCLRITLLVPFSLGWGWRGFGGGGVKGGGVSIRMIPQAHLSEKVHSGGPCFCSYSA